MRIEKHSTLDMRSQFHTRNQKGSQHEQQERQIDGEAGGWGLTGWGSALTAHRRRS